MGIAYIGFGIPGAQAEEVSKSTNVLFVEKNAEKYHWNMHSDFVKKKGSMHILLTKDEN